MDNTTYISLSRQTTAFRNMDVIANNIANADTTGYRAQSMVFNPYNYKLNASGSKGAWVQDISTTTNTAQGAMTTTGRQLDVAINGEGYFAVNTPLGIRYTRAGNFTRGDDGRILTPEGYEVQGEGGQAITLQDTDTDITVHEDGTVTSNADNGERGKFAIFRFDNPQLLKKFGNGFYTASTPGQLDEESRVAQGVLEKSNVQPVVELTRMMQVERSVTSTAKLMSDVHDLQIKSITTLTRQQ
ncbi:MAG: flagellar basal-body rod protein FlgF [Proteobacteria bacterium]|nr:flagellar basal-body rod protein FlgF [Pseudomonadota bacterium]